MSTCATLIGFLGFFVRIPEMMSRFLLNFSWANLFLIPMIVNVEKNKISKNLYFIYSDYHYICTNLFDD